MLLLLKTVRKLYKLIVSEAAPISIALGLALGMVLGLTPLLCWHNLLVAVLILMLRVNISASLIGMGAFKVAGIPLWGAFHALGAQLLSKPDLEQVWIRVVHAPGLSLLGLNNSQVLGSLVVSACLFPVILIGGGLFVKRMRRVLTEEAQNHWLARLVTRSKFLGYLVRMAGD